MKWFTLAPVGAVIVTHRSLEVQQQPASLVDASSKKLDQPVDLAPSASGVQRVSRDSPAGSGLEPASVQP